MKEEELIKGLTYLGTAYNKEFSKTETSLYYDFLKDYNYKVFIKAIKSIIKTSKYLPKVSELVDECEKEKELVKNDVIEFMKQSGYFKDLREYEKANLFVSLDTIPKWLKEDMNKYYKIMNTKELEQKNIKLIGE